MGRLRGAVVVLAVISLFGAGRLACGQGAWGNGPVPGSQQADKHNPTSHNYADFSRGFSQDQFARSQGQVSATPLRSASRPTLSSFGGVTISPLYCRRTYPQVYGLYTDYPYYYPYVLGTDSGYFGPYVAPPVVISGDAQFGPQAVQRFMGVDPVPRPAAQVAARQPRRANDVAAVPAVPRADNRARLNAWRLIDAGDAEFKEQRFPQALARYRAAAAAARDMAEAQFRLGFALVATARYADAAKAFIRGLQLDRNWPDSDFRLDELYGENKDAKQAHLDGLQKALTARPHDPDVLFVLGVFLYFDGHAEAAGPLFRRAEAVLGGLDADHLAGFLNHVPAEKQPQRKPAMELPDNALPDQEAPNKPAQKIPPPPLPAEDQPSGKARAVKPTEKPVDPFEDFDITPPWMPRRP